jgi:hypothetical protein
MQDSHEAPTELQTNQSGFQDAYHEHLPACQQRAFPYLGRAAGAVISAQKMAYELMDHHQ